MINFISEKKRQRYMEALNEATHVGRNTFIIYAKDPQGTRAQSFGCSSCHWYTTNVTNDKLDNEKLYYTKDEFLDFLRVEGEIE